MTSSLIRTPFRRALSVGLFVWALTAAWLIAHVPSPVPRAVAQTTGWIDLSDHITSTRGIPNLSSVVFIGQEGWIASANFPEIYHTADGGETFEIQTLPTEINALAMRNTLEGYAGGQNGRIYHTVNGGGAWVSLGTTGNPVRGLACPPSGPACYAVGDFGSASIITGTVMAKLNTGVSATHLSSVHFPVNSDEGWLCGGAIIRHFVDGAWQGDQTYTTNGYNAIAFADNLNGWAVGDEGVIVHTTTGGKVDGTHVYGWYIQIEPDPHSSQRTSNGLYALNAMEAWAIGDFGVILHTTNGGQTWAPEASGLTTSLLRAVHAEDSHTVYVVGNDGTFLKYTDAAPGFDHSLHLPLIVR